MNDKPLSTEALKEMFSQHSMPWIGNFRDKADGPPYEVWHTGCCGGTVGSFDRLEDAETCAIAVELLHLAAIKRPRLFEELCSPEDVSRETEETMNETKPLNTGVLTAVRKLAAAGYRLSDLLPFADSKGDWTLDKKLKRKR